VIPRSERDFFAATENRIRHVERHRIDNDLALYAGTRLQWDPAELDSRRAEIVQETDYPARLERAIADEPRAVSLEEPRRWILRTVFETHPEIAPYVHGLEERHLRFRPVVNGRPAGRGELARILAAEPDPALREAAWKAVTPLGESLADDLAELFRRRETLARAVLDSGFAGVAFHIHQQERSEVVALLDAFERYTRKAYATILRDVARALSRHEVEPWDLDYGISRLGAEEGEDLAPRIAAGPLSAALEQTRRWECLPQEPSLRQLDLPSPSVLLDGGAPPHLHLLWRPAPGLEGFRTAFGGVGRCLPALFAAPRDFPRSQPPAITEASAEVLEAVTRDAAWLAEVTGAPAHAIDRHRRRRRAARIVRLRRLAAGVAFENLVYAHSDLDPHRLHADVTEQMLQETRRPDVRWPLDLTLVVDPLVRASRILGALIAAQVGEHLREIHPEPWRSREAGIWLRENLLTPDAPWKERVEQATRRPLGIDAFAREMGVAFEGPDLAETVEISDEAAAEYFKDIDLSDLDPD
jgi:hypothetical protein